MILPGVTYIINYHVEKARQKMKKDDNLKMQDSFSAFAEEFVDVRKMETGLLNLLSVRHPILDQYIFI